MESDEPAVRERPDAASPRLADRAVEAVKEQYDRIIRAIMGSCTVDRPTAEDLLQDVYVQILERGVSAEPESVFHYLRIAARNKHLDVRRTEARAEANAATTAAPTPAYLLPDEDRVVEAVAARTLLLDAFSDLDALPQRERTAFVLRHYYDLPPRDIAVEMNLEVKQVDNLLQQARERLARSRASRSQSHTYALIALVLRPVRDNAGTLGSPGCAFASLAATVAFSLVTVVGGGVPAARHPAPPAPTSPHFAARSITRLGSAPSASPGPPTPRELERASLPASTDQAAPRQPSPLTPTLTTPPACTRNVCVSPGDVPARPGDTLTVTAFGQSYHVWEEVVPVCEYVVANPVVQCQRQEPADWIVRDVPPRPGRGNP